MAKPKKRIDIDFEEPKTKVFHKGNLDQPERPEFSTGTDQESVAALKRPGDVHEFEIPTRRIAELEISGDVRRITDADSETGIINEEIRFSKGVVNELKKVRVISSDGDSG